MNVINHKYLGEIDIKKIGNLYWDSKKRGTHDRPAVFVEPLIKLNDPDKAKR